MSQVNSRKRKGDHLDEHPQFNQHNRGYLSINMLNNSNLNHHSIPTTNHNSTIVNSDQNFNNTLTYLNNHQSTVVNNLSNQQSNTTYSTNGQNLFKIDNHLLTNQNHHIPNKLLIINSNTNSSSGSVVDESSRTEFSSIDNLSDVVNLNNSNSTFTNNSQRKQRHETSLGQLTKKFVGLLQDKQGVSICILYFFMFLIL